MARFLNGITPVLCAVSVARCAVLFWTHGVYVASLEGQPIYFGIDTQTSAIMALRPEALHVKVSDEILRHHIEGFVVKHFSQLPVITSREYKGTLLMMDAALTGQGTEVSKDLKEIRISTRILSATSGWKCAR